MNKQILIPGTESAVEVASFDKNNYKTPPEIFEMIDELFEGDYFDPCPANPQWDGLKIKWGRRAYVNPPYGRGELEKWVNKAVHEIKTGNTEEVLFLINYGACKNRIPLIAASTAIVHLTARIAFLNPITDKPVKGNDRDSMLYYIGNRAYKVQEAFSKLGYTYTKDSTLIW